MSHYTASFGDHAVSRRTYAEAMTTASENSKHAGAHVVHPPVRPSPRDVERLKMPNSEAIASHSCLDGDMCHSASSQNSIL